MTGTKRQIVIFQSWVFVPDSDSDNGIISINTDDIFMSTLTVINSAVVLCCLCDILRLQPGPLVQHLPKEHHQVHDVWQVQTFPDLSPSWALQTMALAELSSFFAIGTHDSILALSLLFVFEIAGDVKNHFATHCECHPCIFYWLVFEIILHRWEIMIFDIHLDVSQHALYLVHD